MRRVGIHAQNHIERVGGDSRRGPAARPTTGVSELSFSSSGAPAVRLMRAVASSGHSVKQGHLDDRDQAHEGIDGRPS